MNQKKQNKNKLLLSLVFFPAVFLFGIFSFVIGPNIFSVEYDSQNNNLASVISTDQSDDEFVLNKNSDTEFKKEIQQIKYIKTPDIVRSIYMTACVASTPSFRKNLIDLIAQTEINSIVIDIKDFSGTISFYTENEKLLGVSGTGCRTRDMADLVKIFHDMDVYVIGRITVFQDPFYTSIRPDLAVKKKSDGSVWKDFKGISFIDVSVKEYWDYILELTFESHKKIGFDEINFDYVRFPSDGNMKDIHFPFSDKIISQNEKDGKSIALENFFKYLYEKISDYNQNILKENKKHNTQIAPLVTSVDLFGMTTTTKDDLNIGQILEKALPYFDYVAPMVYPSHYPPHFNGWADPNKYPYELIHFVMGSAIERINEFKNNLEISEEIRNRVSVKQLRTWIQDFNYGGTYGPKEVRAQIDASVDVGVPDFMIWSPSNRYTKDALKSKEVH
ncbi:MAG TPA: putative glycoside hydrolase [Candidatus Paceibacterota bacterium]|nr:putative glycoside hydrolase [Candidatus Paceibacterota bacterium]